MSWQQIYHSKLCSADEAVQAIQSHNRLFMTGNCSVPKELLAALVRRAPELEEVEIVQVLTIGPAEYVEPRMAGHIQVNSLFISANVRKAVNEGRADFTPILLSQIPHALRDPNLLRPDVAMIHCSPPDEHGFCTFGVEVGLTKPAAEAARIVIAEVNDRMPRALGDSFIHVGRLTHIVPVSYPIVEVPMGSPGELQKKIASFIAELIPDGATMQMGIGEIPDAVLLYLRDKRDLGVHTELFSDGVIDLVETGVITNAAKTLHRGKIIAGFALGSQRLYDYMDNNPLFEFHPQDYINDPFVIAQNSKQVAMNSALEVDLTGQVCADSIGPQFYSGVGGQLDFIYGASRSPGGLPIIALPSTAKDGVISRIVPMLKPGAGVVTTRNHVHYIVTEYGVADLHAKTIRQRVKALIDIAAPQFRDELTHFAKEQHWI
ncbi:MAG: 4-hydroxybutyrate CoA-transferase [Chloroflexi bacterium HGW-Chloroflexi-1]|nr:MAG: 4-hydroxybutyrate CoA-transferase [Chloroflexi bacterium HGW-Chloroflexi-1]